MGAKRFTVHNYKDEDDFRIESQWLTDDDGRELYSVYDLNECPEDAIIGRSLFSAYDWIDTVKYGIELAKQGYDSVDIVEVEEEERW